MTSEKPPRGRPRPRKFDDVPELSHEEVERRVDVRGGGTPIAPIERPVRERRPPPREERTVARDSILLIGLVIVGLVAVRVLLPDGPLSPGATNTPGASQVAVVTTGPTASPTRTPGLLTRPPSPTASPDLNTPSAEPTPQPTIAEPTPTLKPGETPKPTPKPTTKPTAIPTPGPTAANRATVVVVMHVVNNNGGGASASDWHMKIAGAASSGASVNNFTGSESPGRSVSIPAGLGYSVTDDASQSGYASRTLAGACSGTGLAAGVTVTCTITRNDRPRLVVKTDVTNNDAGTANAPDWAVTIVAENASPSSFNGSAPGVTVILGAGLVYSVEMSGPSGYDKISESAACSGIIGVDDPNETCTFFFDDTPPPPAPPGVLLPMILPLLRPRSWRTTATG